MFTSAHPKVKSLSQLISHGYVLKDWSIQRTLVSIA